MGGRSGPRAQAESIRVLIADHQTSMRDGLRLILESEGFSVCAEAATAREAVTAAEQSRPDICLMDIRMPGNGIVAAAEVRRRVPGTKIVMLTASSSDEDLFDSLRAGASGYLLKDTNPLALPATLRAALRGEGVLSRRLSARLIEQFRKQEERKNPLVEHDGIKRLSTREWQVLDLLDRGLTTAQIADQLFISTVTVRRHIGDVCKKLSVPDREAALHVFHQA